MDLQLDGKKALVTGSSKGIGEAIAKALAREGATVVVHGRDRTQADAVVGAITAEGGRAHAVVGDLTRDDAVEQLVGEARRLAGPIDILVNNAGGAGGSHAGWAETQPADWTSAFDSNVLAALRVTTRLLPGMRQAKWGRVINISSMAATMPPPTIPEYSAAKAAINAMTASMAKAVAADGVTVNAVSPGMIHSATLDAQFRQIAAAQGLAAEDAPWDEIEPGILRLFGGVPIGRVGRLDELADTVAFLASKAASYITGANLRIDGGMSSSV